MSIYSKTGALPAALAKPLPALCHSERTRAPLGTKSPPSCSLTLLSFVIDPPLLPAEPRARAPLSSATRNPMRNTSYTSSGLLHVNSPGLEEAEHPYICRVL
jgi:hypothetical protein